MPSLNFSFCPEDFDILLPSQLLSYPDRTGAQKLLAGILSQAITDYLSVCRRATPKSQTQTAELRRWFLSPDTDWPASFINCCTALGFDPDIMRQRILAADPPSTRRGPQGEPLPVGVYWHKTCRKLPYYTAVRIDGKQQQVGFKTLHEAVAFHQSHKQTGGNSYDRITRSDRAANSPSESLTDVAA